MNAFVKTSLFYFQCLTKGIVTLSIAVVLTSLVSTAVSLFFFLEENNKPLFKDRRQLLLGCKRFVQMVAFCYLCVVLDHINRGIKSKATSEIVNFPWLLGSLAGSWRD